MIQFCNICDLFKNYIGTEVKIMNFTFMKDFFDEQ